MYHTIQPVSHKNNLPLNYTYYQTPAGQLTVLFTDAGIYNAYFAQNNEAPANHIFLPELNNSTLLLRGTGFQIKVWQAALQIPSGKTVTYQDLAHLIGNPKSFRAVANALGQNKIAYFIPCHRIIRTDGSLGGYRWGIERKQNLLNTEIKY